LSIEVKICGLTNVDDARVALEAGADYLGFVLYSGSPRGISADDLDSILARLDGNYRAVGVFVNETRAHIEEIARACALSAVQIHGDECADQFAGMPVSTWRAVKLLDGDTQPNPVEWPADRYVIDAVAPGMYGGTGVVADWSASRSFAAAHPAMLAGGLTAENVSQAIEAVAPLGVDTSTGVENTPGRKDHDKIRRFIENARAAGSRGDEK